MHDESARLRLFAGSGPPMCDLDAQAALLPVLVCLAAMPSLNFTLAKEFLSSFVDLRS